MGREGLREGSSHGHAVERGGPSKGQLGPDPHLGALKTSEMESSVLWKSQGPITDDSV